MEENCGDDKESQLIEVIRQLNEINQQLKTALVEKEILIKSLQQENLELKKRAGDENKLIECEENENMDFESMELDVTNSGTHESQSQNMNEKSAQVEDSVSSDDNSVEAVAKALRNPLVLTKILRNVRNVYLLNNCRLVNREWRDLSTEILLKRGNIKLHFLQNQNKFSLHPKRSLHLTQLSNLLPTSTKFPCARIGLWGDLKCAQTFLSKYGSIIKGLDLAIPQKMKRMRNLLVNQVPNLERLKLTSIETEGELFPKNAPGPKLTSLTCLKLGRHNSPSLIKAIVDAAPNLQQCTGVWSVEEIEFLLPRLHILKDLSLNPERSDLDALEKLTKMNLKLKYFDMFYQNICLEDEEEDEEEDDEDDNGALEEILTRFDRINSKILFLNRLTLEKIKLTPHHLSENHIEWPEMVNVQKLTLGDEGGQLNLPSFKISEKFPKLHTLCLINNFSSVYPFLDDAVQNSDMFKNVAPTVKVLELYGYFGDLLPHFHKALPNIQQLSLGEIEDTDFPRIAPSIWNMKNLKSLKLNFDGCSTSQIDAGFTGLDEMTCKFLRYSGRGKMEVWETEKFRVNPSILNLTELEELHLPKGFQKESKGDEEDVKKSKPSFVSFKYAFNLMPKLYIFS